MPSGKTHDAITFLLAAPVAATAYWATASLVSALVVGGAFLFGGLMFGPDLDTVSRQYSRWSVFRVMWLPYRSFFKHRSRFSHGLILGAFLRVVYFMGAVTLAAYLVSLAVTASADLTHIEPAIFAQAWSGVGAYIRSHLGESFLIMLFLGLWSGAASHTFTDMAGSFIKTGRAGKFF